ncbi:hypothetical protein E4U12_006553 [Claviceps purpurea]|nr:hypothetical protein E4U12_006553 [Claviceps purpurea]
MSDGLLPDDEAPMYAVERILRAGPWKGTRGMLVKYGEGDDVGEAGTGGYTGSTGKKRKGRAIPLLQNIELQSSEITEDDADDPGEGVVEGG